jgi:hypothetical protein
MRESEKKLNESFDRVESAFDRWDAAADRFERKLFMMPIIVVGAVLVTKLLAMYFL